MCLGLLLIVATMSRIVQNVFVCLRIEISLHCQTNMFQHDSGIEVYKDMDCQGWCGTSCHVLDLDLIDHFWDIKEDCQHSEIFLCISQLWMLGSAMMHSWSREG